MRMEAWEANSRCPPPALLETWSRQGLVVNSLRIQGRESLRSAPAALGLSSTTVLGILATGSWWVLAADRAAFAIPLLVPLDQARFCGGTPCQWVCFSTTRLVHASVSLRLLCLAVAFPEGHDGCECRCHIHIWHDVAWYSRDGSGKLTGIPTRLRSVGTTMGNVG
jgi:hypothetical protein